jgi:hypothetical protein
MVLTKVDQRFVISKIVRQNATNFYVKRVHLICKNAQLHAYKICMRAAVVRGVLCPSR